MHLTHWFSFVTGFVCVSPALRSEKRGGGSPCLPEACSLVGAMDIVELNSWPYTALKSGCVLCRQVEQRPQVRTGPG